MATRSYWDRVAPAHHALKGLNTYDLLTQSREESLQIPGRPTRSHQDDRRILDAIRRQDEAAAQKAMLNHIIAVEELLSGLRREEVRPAAPAKRKSLPAELTREFP